MLLTCVNYTASTCYAIFRSTPFYKLRGPLPSENDSGILVQWHEIEYFLYIDIFIGYMMIVCPLEIVDSTSLLMEWSEGNKAGCSCPQIFALYCPYGKYPDCWALQDTSSRCKISLTCVSLLVIYLLCMK